MTDRTAELRHKAKATRRGQAWGTAEEWGEIHPSIYAAHIAAWSPEAALAALDVIEAAQGVWDSVPASYDPEHETVIRHANALANLRDALTAFYAALEGEGK